MSLTRSRRALRLLAALTSLACAIALALTAPLTALADDAETAETEVEADGAEPEAGAEDAAEVQTSQAEPTEGDDSQVASDPGNAPEHSNAGGASGDNPPEHSNAGGNPLDDGDGDDGDGFDSDDDDANVPRAGAGTVKINGVDPQQFTANNPHPGCVFSVELFGFQGDFADLTFEIQAPSGSGELLSQRVELTGDTQGNELSGSSGLLDLGSLLRAAGATGHPQQGFHVKLTTEAEDARGAGKHKVFWISCPEEEVVDDEDEIITDEDDDVADDDEETVTRSRCWRCWRSASACSACAARPRWRPPRRSSTPRPSPGGRSSSSARHRRPRRTAPRRRRPTGRRRRRSSTAPRPDPPDLSQVGPTVQGSDWEGRRGRW
jgi:hypothetical protein